MEKKTISVHAVTIHMYVLIIALLVMLLAVVGLKYLHLKFAVHNFTQGTMMLNANQQPVGTIADYATIIATAVSNYPANTSLTQSAVLQNYVTMLSKSLQRDIVVIDKSRKILADTVKANVGQNYTQDVGKEVDLTLKDGVSRSFVENSADYPQGLSEVVVPVKDTSSQVIGVVLVSNTTVYK